MEELSELDSDLGICKIKRDEAKSLVEKYVITEVPTTLIYVGNEFKEKIDGYLEADEIEEQVNLYK